MSLERLRIGAIFGSRSVEHEISVITACQAMPVLTELGAEVIPIYITKQGSWLTHPSFSELATFRKGLPQEGEPVLLDLRSGKLSVGGGGRFSRPRELVLDLLFPLTHGTMGEDGSLAGLAELARIPQLGSGTLAAALAMDKYRSKQLFAQAGLPVVPAALVGPQDLEREALRVGFPLVVKPNRGGSSIGVALVEGPEGLSEAAELALRYDSALLLERAVPGAQDLNCAVKLAAPRTSPVERPLKGERPLSYSDKYAGTGSDKAAGPAGSGKVAGDGRRELPAQIPDPLRDQVQELALAAFDLLGCSGTARVDFLLSEEGELYLNEVNTIPGSMAFYLWEAGGISYPQLLEELVRWALTRSEARELSLPQNLLSGQELLGKR